jgi:hypothetical protein
VVTALPQLLSKQLLGTHPRQLLWSRLSQRKIQMLLTKKNTKIAVAQTAAIADKFSHKEKYKSCT